MESGGGASDRALPQVPGVRAAAAAPHLVATGAPHHQDRLLLHHLGLRQRGEPRVLKCTMGQVKCFGLPSQVIR